ncbi:ATP-binding protein [Rhodopirellula sallentina]|uniref:Putative membrane protein n=1 Tax=Rhodopirellula sallentina SM41 TaxID=1263870 RepID=M5UIE7_9BACT|nr:AAA family ATPase [Rhodopirellula sallentina]EMI55793.1 putative membrane protein [Rhodopirellula sallentina SM41]
MKIKDIQIDGFGVWTGLSVDSLSEGMTLFYGPNEAGKTTLMQFLRAMLYGFTPERRGRYLPPIHGGSPGGAIRVTGPGGGYEIRRHSQLTDADTTGRLTVTGTDGLSQGQHRLSMLLGQIDEPIFTNVFAIGIRELQELSTLDDTSAADELYKLSSGLDRVSLVDVLRSLRAGRTELIGKDTSSQSEEEAAANHLAGLLTRREKLRDEIQRLTGQTRRWSEMATQRRTQSQEIESLRGRMVAWEREARCVEIATSVHEPWQKRAQLTAEIEAIEGEAHLPDDAPSQLVQIDALIEERKAKIEEIRNRRRSLRDKAEQLPVNKRLFDLQGRIEAATQQATWVEALEEQIDRIDTQIEKARKQVEADADRLGIDEHERMQIAEGDTGSLPDLSRSTLAALSGPAKNVKEQSFLLKQARTEGKTHKARAEKLGEKLQDVLNRAHASDLQQAIRRENDNISSLRHRIQLGQHLEKLTRHYRDLESESIELTTDEALPMDRLFLLGLPFVVGGMLVLYGLFNVFQITTFVARPNPTQGMLCIMFGAMALLVYYLSRERGQRSTVNDLEDCERQIESVRRQIREIESEREEVDSHLPTSNESLEARLRESETLLAELEESLPVYHSHEAAMQSYKASYARATKAAEGMKEARREWTATLDRLGLANTLSPKSVRTLGDGYETLQASLRRLQDLRDEREQRRRERQTIAKRIETLYIEALDASEGNTSAAEHGYNDEYEPEQRDSSDRNRNKKREKNRRSKGNRDSAQYRSLGPNGYEDDYENVDQDRYQDDDSESFSRRTSAISGSASTALKSRSNPLDQLNHLHEELARQQHWIKQRRDLKAQDQQYKKQHASHASTIERAEQQRRALWAKCGVATAEQFYQIVDRKSLLAQLMEERDSVDKQIRTMIGTSVQYEDVEREIEGAKASDLERRWDSLTTRMTETEARIASMQTAQGELAASMKQLGDDDRLMTARLELGCVERKLDKLARRWQTLATASCLLEDVCGTFERERQPETLREASSFLNQLTDGKYTRIWTPLGTNQLKIDDNDGKALPLEVLSRGTGEAVFIALRLSLAAAYARRGVMLPLVLDDVLVNFDGERAEHAARTLQTFAELGHQVMMFTCHDHIVEIFHQIGVEVRQMPAQGTPGRASILPPPEESYEYEEPEYEEEMEEEEPEPMAEIIEPEPEPEPMPAPEPLPVVVTPPPLPLARPASLVVENRVQPTRPKPPKSKYRFGFEKLHRQHRRRRAPEIKIAPKKIPQPEPVRETRVIVEREPEPITETRVVDNSIGWAWFEREPADGRIDAEEAAAQATRNQWLAEEDRVTETETADDEYANGEFAKSARYDHDSDNGGDEVTNEDERSWWHGEKLGRAS